MPHRVGAGGIALRISRCVDDVRARGRQRVDVRCPGISNDVAEGMIFFDYHYDVIERRRLRLGFGQKANGRANKDREPKNRFHV